MNNPHYPSGTVRALLDSEHVSPITRMRMLDRLDTPPTPNFFTLGEHELLQAVSARLTGQQADETPIPIAAFIDMRLSKGMADGWRYDTMPTDGEAYQWGLQGLEETAQQRFGAAFGACAPTEQDAVLSAVQNGEVQGGAWERVVPARFFEEMLSEVAVIFYAHPDSQDEIGYVGFADVPNWSKIELNQHEAREPLALESQNGDAPPSA